MINWKNYAWSVLPFIVGLLVGGGLSMNKWIWLVLIIYIISSVGFTLLSDKILRLKKSTDKKIEAKKMGAEIMTNTVDYVSEGHSIGFKIFDTIFPNVSVILGLALVVVSGYLFFKSYYFEGLISSFMVIIYILLINILRNTKRGDINV